MGNARQKPVAKATSVQASRIGERLFINICSIATRAFGGAKFCVLAVDDFTNKSWSFFITHKDEQVDPLVELLLLLHKNGTPIYFIRLDNAGENKLLEESVRNHGTIYVTFEYVPPCSPQYNVRAERKFAYLWGGVRAVLNAAKLPEN